MADEVRRRLAAILAADVAGYSRLVGADEEGTLARLRALFREAVQPAVAARGGRVFKLMGDALLAEFPSAVEAVRCAAEIQDAAEQRGAGEPEDRRVRLRVGVHLGDVVIEGSDLLGDGVNVAARLEGLAEPGGVVISAKVADEVRGRVPFALEDLGERALKNIERPVRAFLLRAPGGPPPPHAAQRPALPLPDRPSLAVLPFRNMSGDPEQEYFTDGMVEDITTALSRIRWLFVIARNSAFAYKGRVVDVRQVGRELGVRYVLEGSVRRTGGRVRIAGQLMEAETGRHIWADHFDGEPADVFELQDRVAAAVAGAIEPSLRRVEIERARRRRPDNLDAYDLVLRALPHVYTEMPDDATAAAPLLERALRLEPGYAVARAALAWGFHNRFSRGGLREDDRAAALTHARAALADGGDDASALAIAAFVLCLDAHDEATAFAAFDRALALSPSNVFALACSAVVLAWTGCAEAAEERARRALRLSPIDPMNYLPHCALAIAHFQRGRHEEALAAARGAIIVAPRFSLPHAYEAAALARLGRGAEAAAAARRVLELQPGFTVRGFAVTVGINPAVFGLFEEAWREAGLPP